MKYRDKFTLLTFLILFLAYNAVGYIFDIQELKILILKNNGITLSFIALIVPVLLSYIIFYSTRNLKKT